MSVIHIYPGDSEIECPYCKNILTKENPILSAHEGECKAKNLSQAIYYILDGRPKCSFCYKRLDLVIHF